MLNEINNILKELKFKKSPKYLNSKTTNDFITSINEIFNKETILFSYYEELVDKEGDIYLI